jgi:hypothetical protein
MAYFQLFSAKVPGVVMLMQFSGNEIASEDSLFMINSASWTA